MDAARSVFGFSEKNVQAVWNVADTPHFPRKRSIIGCERRSFFEGA